MSYHNQPYYSDKYTDENFEYRHVHIPKEWVRSLPKDRCMTEGEWRELGVTQRRRLLYEGPHFCTKFERPK